MSVCLHFLAASSIFRENLTNKQTNKNSIIIGTSAIEAAELIDLFVACPLLAFDFEMLSDFLFSELTAYEALLFYFIFLAFFFNFDLSGNFLKLLELLWIPIL